MNGSEPCVSVVIVFLNEERFLREAVDSVLGQSYDDWELLLVDDGSTDRSSLIARDYAADNPQRIVYLEHPDHCNLGISASRNLGIAAARGKYVAFLDADDLWLPQKLSEQVSMLEKCPEALMLFGTTLIWYSWTESDQIGLKDRITDFGLVEDSIIEPPLLLEKFLRSEKNLPSVNSVLIRRSVFEKVGNFEESFHGMYEDMIFYCKVWLNYPVLVSTRTWDIYRQRADSVCALAIADGQLDASRKRYLEWISAYMLAHGYAETEVWYVLQEQLRRYRSLRLYKLKKRVRKGVRAWKNALLGAVR